MTKDAQWRIFFLPLTAKINHRPAIDCIKLFANKFMKTAKRKLKRAMKYRVTNEIKQLKIWEL